MMVCRFSIFVSVFLCSFQFSCVRFRVRSYLRTLTIVNERERRRKREGGLRALRSIAIKINAYSRVCILFVFSRLCRNNYKTGELSKNRSEGFRRRGRSDGDPGKRGGRRRREFRR